MPRFVILLHVTPKDSLQPTHWDLLLEDGEVLASWALAAPPAPDRAIVARQLPPHRIRYLRYEGPISKNRGTVSRWDSGEFQWLERNDGSFRIRIEGQRVLGQIELQRSLPNDLVFIADSVPEWTGQFRSDT